MLYSKCTSSIILIKLMHYWAIVYIYKQIAGRQELFGFVTSAFWDTCVCVCAAHLHFLADCIKFDMHTVSWLFPAHPRPW